MGLADAVPEKKGDKPFGTNKFVLNLVSGGAAAAIAKTATASIGGNIASVARYAPSQALNFAFYDLYKNAVNSAFPQLKNERTSRFFAHFYCGGFAGITTLGITQSLEHAFTRRAAHKEAFHGRIPNIKGFTIFYSYYATFIHRAAYFAGYDKFKEDAVSQFRKLNLFSSCFFALASTSMANIFMVPVHTLGQVIALKPEHKAFHELSMNKPAVLMLREGRYAQLISERRYLWNSACYSIGYVKTVFKKEGYAKQFAFRCVTGALVLAGFDEIQKWLR